MAITTFFVYTDKEGKMPVMSRKMMHRPTHPCYVRYVDDRPVSGILHTGQQSVWNYSTQQPNSVEMLNANSHPKTAPFRYL